MRGKRYTGRSRWTVRKVIAAVLIIGGAALLFGGAGHLDHDYISLKHGIIMMFSGCANLLVGLSLGGLLS